MESLNGAVEPAVPSCSLEKQGCFSPLQERISKLLSQWTALQMAVQNEWGGCDSLKKSEQLAYDVLSWLFQSIELLQVEDLENLLHERLLLSFNTEIEDGSIEEVAEQLMIIREDHLQGNLVSVQLNENHQKVVKRGQQTPAKVIIEGVLLFVQGHVDPGRTGGACDASLLAGCLSSRMPSQ